MKKRMLCFFELEKKLNKKYTRGGKKNDKTLAWWLYKSFEEMYSWILYNKNWKIGHFRYLSISNAEEIAHEWILMKLNPLEGKDLWLNPSSKNETQQDQQSGEDQIILQEVIDMINAEAYEKMMGDVVRNVETIGDVIRRKVTRGDKRWQWLSKVWLVNLEVNFI